MHRIIIQIWIKNHISKKEQTNLRRRRCNTSKFVGILPSVCSARTSLTIAPAADLRQSAEFAKHAPTYDENDVQCKSYWLSWCYCLASYRDVTIMNTSAGQRYNAFTCMVLNITVTPMRFKLRRKAALFCGRSRTFDCTFWLRSIRFLHFVLGLCTQKKENWFRPLQCVLRQRRRQQCKCLWRQSPNSDHGRITSSKSEMAGQTAASCWDCMVVVMSWLMGALSMVKRAPSNTFPWQRRWDAKRQRHDGKRLWRHIAPAS